MAVVVGKLCVLKLRVQVGHIFREFKVTPQPTGSGFLWVARQNLACFFCGGVLLLLGPHAGCIGLIVPHGGAVEGVHKHIGLVHVAGHALRRRYGAGELVRDRVAGLIFRNGHVAGCSFTLVAKAGVGPRVFGVAVIGVGAVAGGATRRSVVTGLFVGSQKPQVWVVQASFGDVDEWHGNAAARARTAVRLLDVRAPRLIQFL